MHDTADNRNIMDRPAGRRRNRATLVCTECRRRKIACDRQHPCKQCVRNAITCTYPVLSKTLTTRSRSPRTSRLPESTLSEQTHALDHLGSSGLPSPYRHAQVPPEARPDQHAQSVATTEDSLSTSTNGRPLLITSSDTSPGDQNLGLLLEGPTAYSTNFVNVLGQEVKGFGGQPQPLLKERFFKSQLFGASHWRSGAIRVGTVCSSSLFEELARLEHSVLFDESSIHFKLLAECRRIARQLKDLRLNRVVPVDLRAYLPPQNTCRNLVQAYFRTFETVFRILHIPTFERELESFWSGTLPNNNTFVVKLLLVMAIGTCFDQEPMQSPENSLYGTAAEWIRAANMWVETPVHKKRMNLEGIQIHCLLALAFQTNSVGGDLSWIFAGCLLRIAMTIGLHRDPACLPLMTPLEHELRKRLWATTLEIVLQSSLDSGMPPLLSSDSFDCPSPSNIDDTDIDETSAQLPQPKPTEVYTQTSTQCALFRSFITRLKIAQLLNGLHSNPPYEEVLRLGAELTSTCRANSKLFHSFIKRPGPGTESQSLVFQIKILDLLTRRFLLSLHIPYADAAYKNLAYYFSRRVCLESSLLLLSYSVPAALQSERKEDDYTRLRVLGRGTYKHTCLIASSQLCFELVMELLDDSAPSTSILPRKELYQAMQKLVETTLRRIREGETNVKAYVFFACAMAQIDAMQSGSPMAPAIAEAAQKALEACYSILKARLDKVTDQPVNGNIENQSDFALLDPSNFLDPMINGDEFMFPDPNLDFDFANDWIFPISDFS